MPSSTPPRSLVAVVHSAKSTAAPATRGRCVERVAYLCEPEMHDHASRFALHQGTTESKIPPLALASGTNVTLAVI
jgi:hypothetical protein